MTTAISQGLGGLGLLLIGMKIMTGALRSLADETLRDTLARTVKNPWKGAFIGAIATALLQSSSATTVIAVGFVGAGLLSFSESLGIIFGANIGTTVTGWLVALLGFKFDLGQAMLPMIFFGAVLQMTRRTSYEQIGMALAGFGLVFVGIGALQTGLAGLQGTVTPEWFPPDTPVGRILLLMIGLVITIITQSSSAGVATALAAVHTGTITLPQAAAMVIGMDLGTTATAAMATLGGSVQAKRTGFAHVIYNSMTAIAAMFLLTPYIDVVGSIFPSSTVREPELVLVGFHTFFNGLGVLVILPFTNLFAKFIIRLFPERGNPLTRQLDSSLLDEPTVSLEAVNGTLWEITSSLLSELGRRLGDPSTNTAATLMEDLSDAIKQTSDYLQQLSDRDSVSQTPRYLTAMHVLDHLKRMHSRLRDDKRLRRCKADAGLTRMSDELSRAMSILADAPRPITKEESGRLQEINRYLKTSMRKYRNHIVAETAEGKLSTSDALRRMDTNRWLRRIGYHLWRISFHRTQNSE